MAKLLSELTFGEMAQLEMAQLEIGNQLLTYDFVKGHITKRLFSEFINEYLDCFDCFQYELEKEVINIECIDRNMNELNTISGVAKTFYEEDHAQRLTW